MAIAHLSRLFSVLIVMSAFFLPPDLYAQKDTAKSIYSENSGDLYAQMLDYSRPTKNHQLMANLVGTWTSKGKHLTWKDSGTSEVSLEFRVTVVRRSFANGRYFISDVTSEGELEMPIQDGKMKTTRFQGHEIEGYDNVKRKYIRCSIGNHFGSGIMVIEGVYDSTANTITFDSEVEMAPGFKTKEHLVHTFQDADHYKWEYYQEDNGKRKLATVIDFERVKK